MEQVCNPVVGSEKQELTNVEVTEVSPEERVIFLGCLANEFIDPADRATFLFRTQACLLTTPQQVVASPDINPRGACLIGMRDVLSGQPIGASLLKLYATKLIAPQLNIDLDFDRDKVRLVHFGEMQTKAGIPSDASAVAEYAYYWIRPECRGNGHGTRITTASREVIQSAFGDLPVATFGIVRCTEETAQHGHALFQHLLAQEVEVNGADSVQRPIVTGVPVPLKAALQNIGIPEKCVTRGIDPRAQASKHIFEQYGLKPVGYTKGLAPIYAGVLS